MHCGGALNCIALQKVVSALDELTAAVSFKSMPGSITCMHHITGNHHNISRSRMQR